MRIPLQSMLIEAQMNINVKMSDIVNVRYPCQQDQIPSWGKEYSDALSAFHYIFYFTNNITPFQYLAV